jgi:ribosome-associated heat shock protein Hsp15
MNKVRVDKWLWAVRLFKSRSQASDQCRKGKITLNGKVLKPSHLVEAEQILGVHKNGFNLSIKIVEIISKRVSATLAAPCYEDLTSDEEKNKFNTWFIGKGRTEIREKGVGRPTKKDRREIENYKSSVYQEWLLDE